jgi:hypothetical protein
VAIAAIVIVIMLPVKPTSPQGELESGLGRGTSPQVAPPNSVQTPVPVRVTPVNPEPVKQAASPAPPEPDKPAAAKPATGPVPAGPASNVADGGDSDEPDEPDSPGTTSKPGAGHHDRTAAKAARAAARAAAKAVKASEAENPPVQAALKTLTPEAQRQNMLRAEGRFKACIKEAWGSYVTISIVVDNTGSVQKAELIGPLNASATGHCISEQIRKQHFPPFTEGGSKQFVWSYQIPAAN